MPSTMNAAYLPGNSTVEMRTVPVPTPGHGEVLLAVKASTICGSDIRAIYASTWAKVLRAIAVSSPDTSPLALSSKPVPDVAVSKWATVSSSITFPVAGSAPTAAAAS
jgi:hypothetical protein